MLHLSISRGCESIKRYWLTNILIYYVLIVVLTVLLAGCGFLRNTGMPDTGEIQIGIASWYGGKFHGRITTNGERYNMYKISAAHRTLP